MRASQLFLTVAFVLPILANGAFAQETRERGADPGIDHAAPPPAARYAGATTGSGAFAPVGHRQPTLGSLPDSAREAPRPAVDPLGPLPQICNRC